MVDNHQGDQGRAIVLLSGGMDSTTCLAIAIDAGFECIGLSFDYGQRSQSELDAATRVAKHYDIRHRVIALDPLSFQGSALTDADIPMPTMSPADEGESPEEAVDEIIPVTYVPARNTLFLAYALGLAESMNAKAIYIGANAIDYSGYPDCRPEFLAAFQQVMTLGTKCGVEGHPIELTAPLQDLSKAEIVQRAIELKVDLAQTVSCYQADEQGRACGVCDSCVLRQQGFLAAGVDDPTLYANSGAL